MKNFFLLSFFIFILSSCTTSAGIIYDDTIPLEETAWIGLFNLGTITGYNGVSVNWKLTGPKMVQIPAGDTLLEVNLFSDREGITYRGEGLIFRYNFQKQKQYFFQADIQNTIRGLRVHEYDFGERVAPPNDYAKHYVGFVPFLNVQHGPTILQ